MSTLDLRGILKEFLSTLANSLSAAKISYGELAIIYTSLKSVEDNVDDLLKSAKAHLTPRLLQEGEVVTDAGTRRLTRDGWTFEIRPTRTGTDPKKLQAWLEKKKLDVARFMEPTTVYKISEDGKAKLLSMKKLTPSELQSLDYDESWAVQTPKLAGE